MAPKKKKRKTLKKLKRTAAKKATPKKKSSKPQPKKKPSKKPAGKRRAPKKAIAKKKIATKRIRHVPKKRNAPKRSGSDNTAFLRGGPRSKSGGQSGDLQGLSHRASVDSESVDELVEEGNAFEAGVVMGVEDAGKADESEVRTHEVSEDDVPAEYLEDKD
jgi:hypothetical protein